MLYLTISASVFWYSVLLLLSFTLSQYPFLVLLLGIPFFSSVLLSCTLTRYCFLLPGVPCWIL